MKKDNSNLHKAKKNKNDEFYTRYDTYDAVNTDRRTMIPDTDGLIGVPIDFLDILHPQQFEIVGELMNGAGRYDYARPIVEGKKKYTRLLIKRV